MEPRFELFEHTADLGVRVWAPSRAALVAPAVAGLYACVGELTAGGGAAPVEYRFTADEPALLVHDLLGELLHALMTRRALLTDVAVAQFDDTALVVRGALRPVDERVSALHHEVKAVTYHELELGPHAGGWQLVFIVDL
jgi:SHS2 domain-containing protein